ncbi:hypothetical protein [Xanthovirga aplysinae]|uniref:hypothetical protein n=1 Tax=Xanthovirga aplysinae TaxID=2529853 RepID=UPI0012BC5A83|nr:hypothetical protein [Xanthovirga aplysinae]MTI31274.1 hypothetical protein [Xanthovirga aplysinae]
MKSINLPENSIKFLKCIFEDGVVYLQIKNLSSPTDEFIYEGFELLCEEGTWESDEYELSEADVQEMIEEDGFFEIAEDEFKEALKESGISKS